jgi:hypothetical protein
VSVRNCRSPYLVMVADRADVADRLVKGVRTRRAGEAIVRRLNAEVVARAGARGPLFYVMKNAVVGAGRGRSGQGWVIREVVRGS